MTEQAIIAIAERLRVAGLRPTRQRVALGRCLFGSGDRHVSAEMLHTEARAAGMQVSLATVYNTLHQFTAAGLLREVAFDGGRAFFDTNTSDHQHFYFERNGELIDVEAPGVAVVSLPALPAGTRVARIDVLIRLVDAADG